MRNPRPTKIRITVGQDVSEMEIGQRVSWARVAESLFALDAELLQALDAKGNLVRACKPQEPGELDEEDDELGGGASTLASSPVVAVDAETQRWVLFAQLLSSGYKDAQAQAGLRTEVAFNRMIDLFEAVAASNEAKERALDSNRKTIDKLQSEALKQALQRASAAGDDERGGLVDQIIERFMGGVNFAEGETETPPPAPNGKDPH